MDPLSRFILPGGLFLVTLVFGVWLSRSGKPYNGILFNMHKLIALGAVIVTAISIYQAIRSAEIQGLLVALIGLAGVCVVALFVTGALMSVGHPAHDILRAIHSVAPFVMVIALAAMIYLVTGRRL
jgi:hypothetical protein